MGFLIGNMRRENNPTSGVSLDLLHKHECNVCPLNTAKDLLHPKMKPNGSFEPVVYMLGEAPGRTEDKYGEAFVGASGDVLREHIPEKWLDDLRWSNTVRCRPTEESKSGDKGKNKLGPFVANPERSRERKAPDVIINRPPTMVEVECCRNKLVRDIEATKPEAIFGFGGVPLHWLIGESGIGKWRGKRLPVQIGSHRCWYYAHFHPSHIMRARDDRTKTKESRDLDYTFDLDLKNAFADVSAGLPEPVVHAADFARQDVEIITGENGDADLERALDLLARLADEEVAGFDFETKRTRPYHNDARLLTFAVSGADKTVAIALEHPQAGWRKPQRERLFKGLEDFLYEAKARKVAHHLAFELEWAAFLFGYGVVHAGRYGDSISQAFVLDERQGALSLEFLCWQHFGLNIKGLGRPLDKNNLDKEPLAEVLAYNGVDAKYHRLLYAAQKRELEDDGTVAVYAHHLRRVQATVLTQIKGVPVAQEEVCTFYRKFHGELRDCEARIAALPEAKEYLRYGGKQFRPSAPADLKKMLKSVCRLDEVETTKEEELKKIDEPIVDLVLEWRGINKLLSTYVLPLMTMASAEAEAVADFTADDSVVFPDGLLHPIISTIKTRTWRTSSEDPNSQNFPKRENREIRRQIRHPDATMRVVSFDYAGIQARNIAMESLDKKLIDSFWNRYDIHGDWLERIVKIAPEMIKEGAKTLAADKELFKKYRHKAKNGFVFPSFFGAQPPKISAALGISEHKSADLQDELWHMFPEVKVWQKGVVEGYNKHGYVTGLSGFRRHAPVSITELINAPIQADEAIIVLTAMAELCEMGEPRLHPNMEIHDDLTFIWPKGEVERNAETVIDTMLNTPYDWAHVVPIGVEMSVGPDWDAMEAVGEYFSDQWSGRLKAKAA